MDAIVDVPLMMVEVHCFTLKMYVYNVMYNDSLLRVQNTVMKFETKMNRDITTDSIQEKSLFHFGSILVHLVQPPTVEIFASPFS